MDLRHETENKSMTITIRHRADRMGSTLLVFWDSALWFDQRIHVNVLRSVQYGQIKFVVERPQTTTRFMNLFVHMKIRSTQRPSTSISIWIRIIMQIFAQVNKNINIQSLRTGFHSSYTPHSRFSCLFFEFGVFESIADHTIPKAKGKHWKMSGWGAQPTKKVRT